MVFSNETGRQDQDGENIIRETVSNISPNQNVSMELDNAEVVRNSNDQVEVVTVEKTHHHLLKFIFLSDNKDEIKRNFESIQQIVTQELKINLLNAFLNLEKKTAYASVEYENEMNLIASFNFDTKGITAVCKSLTNNDDLDKRKVRISRPTTGRIEIKLIEQALSKFGDIEELYEVKSNPRKRTFVAAFIDEEHKLNMLKMNSLFIGSNNFKVENFMRVPEIKKPDFVVRISNIRNTNTEFTVKSLLQNMRAEYWHMPIAKNGTRMPTIIAHFASEIDYERVLHAKWIFDNREVYVSKIDESICFRCAQKGHFMKECPLKPVVSTKANGNVNMSKNTAVKILPTIDAWKEESRKLIQEHTNNKDQVIDELRKAIEETRCKLKMLEDENKAIRDEMKKEQDKTKELIEGILQRQLEFGNCQNMFMEKLNTATQESTMRHNEIMNFLQTLYAGASEDKHESYAKQGKMHLRPSNGKQ